MRLLIIIVNWEIFCWPADGCLTHAHLSCLLGRFALVVRFMQRCGCFLPPVCLLIGAVCRFVQFFRQLVGTSLVFRPYLRVCRRFSHFYGRCVQHAASTYEK